MLKRLLRLLVVVCVTGLAVASPRAQMRPRPVADETGDVALQLQLRKLRTVGTFMMTDRASRRDENNALLAQIGVRPGPAHRRS